MLTLYGRRSAFNVQKALWGLGEVGADFEHVPLGGDHGGLDPPSRSQGSATAGPSPPSYRTPAPRSGRATRSCAIWRRVTARARSGPRTRPSGPRPSSGWTGPRPRCSPISWRSSGRRCGRRKGERDPARLARAVEALTARYRLLDGILAERPYLAGERFTLADIPAGATLYRYFEMTGIARPALPHLAAWYTRLRERPAYREHVMRPFDELRGKLAY